MSIIAQLLVTLGMDASQFSRGMDDVQKKSTGLSKLNDTFTQLTGVSLTGVGAVLAVGKALSFSLGEAQEAAEVNSQLGAVLKSTGGAAGMTSDALNDLAEGLGYAAAKDDELVLSGEAVMLTFTKIGREAFPDAMASALDMSAALKQDLQSSVILVGKALNNPIQGLTALTRVGVAFTDEQKNMIRTLVESGDVLGAQKVILQELQTEFGGAAAAAGDTRPYEKLKLVLADIAETAGSSVLPELNKLAEGVLNQVKSERDLTEAMEEQRMTSAMLGDSYAEYVHRTMDVLVAEGKMGQAKADLIAANIILRGGMGMLAHDFDILTTAEYEAIDATNYQLRAFDEMEAQLVEQTTPAVNDLEQAEADLKQQMNELSLFMKGPLGEENARYAEDLDELKQKNNELQAEIDELEAKDYLTDEQKVRLEELKGQLDENKQAVTALADEHDEATKRILFDLMQQQMGLDGLDAKEFDVLQRTANQWGLVDDATYQAWQQIATYIGQLQSGKISADQFTAALLGIPTHLETEIVITERYNRIYADEGPRMPHNYGDYQQQSSTTSGSVPSVTTPHINPVSRDRGTYGASGLDFYVPAGFPNDTYGPIWVSSGEHVQVETNPQARDRAGDKARPTRGGRTLIIDVGGINTIEPTASILDTFRYLEAMEVGFG